MVLYKCQRIKSLIDNSATILSCQKTTACKNYLEKLLAMYIKVVKWAGRNKGTYFNGKTPDLGNGGSIPPAPIY